MDIILKEAGLNELEEITPLFDAFRVLSQKESDLLGAKLFLSDRLKSGEMVVVLAYNTKNNAPIGLMLLNQTYSTISMTPVLVLNLLYIVPEFRKKGIAKKLISKAIRYAQKQGAETLRLFTAANNVVAKGIFESAGFIKVPEIDMYHLSV